MELDEVEEPEVEDVELLLVEEELELSPQSLEQLFLFSPASVEHFLSPQNKPFPEVEDDELEQTNSPQPTWQPLLSLVGGEYLQPEGGAAHIGIGQPVEDEDGFPLVVELLLVVDEVVMPLVELEDVVEELEQSQIKQPLEPVFKEQP